MAATAPAVPALYCFVFLYLEPLSTLVGAVEAFFFQSHYLHLTHASTAPRDAVPLGTSIVLSQLANLYLLLSLNEFLLLRVTRDPAVWRCLMLVLLIADLGHLYSVRPVGAWVFWRFWSWNPIDWGNVGFVYFLALTRIALLAGVGFAAPRRHGTGKKTT